MVGRFSYRKDGDKGSLIKDLLEHPIEWESIVSACPASDNPHFLVIVS